jgi:hypothetical protein
MRVCAIAVATKNIWSALGSHSMAMHSKSEKHVTLVKANQIILEKQKTHKNLRNK